jgi:hypothetical protein
MGRAPREAVRNLNHESRRYKMTQNPSDQKQNTNDQKQTCEVCHQSFNSDRELQEHQKNAHSQRKQSESQPGSERNSKNPGQEYPGQDQHKRDKIA